MSRTVRVPMRMERVFPEGRTPDDIFNEAMKRWGGDPAHVSDEVRRTVMMAMKEQVVARFSYDYLASFDYSSGIITFSATVENESERDEGTEITNPETMEWSLLPYRKKSGGLIQVEDGCSFDEVIDSCEAICRKFAWVALSYSAAGVIDHE